MKLHNRHTHACVCSPSRLAEAQRNGPSLQLETGGATVGRAPARPAADTAAGVAAPVVAGAKVALADKGSTVIAKEQQQYSWLPSGNTS